MQSEMILFRAAMTRKGEMALARRPGEFKPNRPVLDPVTLTRPGAAQDARKAGDEAKPAAPR